MELQEVIDKQSREQGQMKERLAALSSHVTELEEDLDTARKDLIKSEEANTKLQRDAREVRARGSGRRCAGRALFRLARQPSLSPPRAASGSGHAHGRQTVPCEWQAAWWTRWSGPLSPRPPKAEHGVRPPCSCRVWAECRLHRARVSRRHALHAGVSVSRAPVHVLGAASPGPSLRGVGGADSRARAVGRL